MAEKKVHKFGHLARILREEVTIDEVKARACHKSEKLEHSIV